MPKPINHPKFRSIAPKPVIINPYKAADIGIDAKKYIAADIKLKHLALELSRAPVGKGITVALIFTRRAWKILEGSPMPDEFKADFGSFEVGTMAEALEGARIPCYIAEGALNVEDCVEEIVHFWPEAHIIRVR
jgi:hypothetical protein